MRGEDDCESRGLVIIEEACFSLGGGDRIFGAEGLEELV